MAWGIASNRRDEDAVEEKQASKESRVDAVRSSDGGDDGIYANPNHHLHRSLSSRQVTMIAIGGAIGTGLIIGT